VIFSKRLSESYEAAAVCALGSVIDSSRPMAS